MDIRDATPSDGAGIGAIHAASWRSAYAGILPAAYLDRLEPERLARTWRLRIEKRSVGHVWVATEGGELVGFVTVHRSAHPSFPAHRAEIGWLYVSPARTGGGVGSALLEHALAALEAGGMRWVTVDVLEANVRARAFYEKRRFQLGSDRWRDPRLGARVVRYEQPLNRAFDFRAFVARERQVR